MADMIDKKALLTAAFPEEIVELQRGGCVKVRAMTRGEALQIAGKKMPLAESERWVLSRTVVEPKLTEEDIAAWQEASPAGEIQEVFETVNRLSGMEEEADKEAYKQFRE